MEIGAIHGIEGMPAGRSRASGEYPGVRHWIRSSIGDGSMSGYYGLDLGF
jgi:hypothetical protein